MFNKALNEEIREIATERHNARIDSATAELEAEAALLAAKIDDAKALIDALASKRNVYDDCLSADDVFAAFLVTLDDQDQHSLTPEQLDAQENLDVLQVEYEALCDKIFTARKEALWRINYAAIKEQVRLEFRRSFSLDTRPGGID